MRYVELGKILKEEKTHDIWRGRKEVLSLPGSKQCIGFFLATRFLSKAIRKFWHHRDVDGLTTEQAAAKCWEVYKGIHLVDYQKWTPTKGNPDSRRGPVPAPFKMTKKTGPKPKLSSVEIASAKQDVLRHTTLSNSALAQRLETRY